MLLSGKETSYLPNTAKPAIPKWMPTLPEDPQEREKTRAQVAKARYEHIERIQAKFWKRWQTEYLHTLQPRKKWQVESENLKVGDLVLVTDERTQCYQWPMGRVQKTIAGPDGVVRNCVVKTSADKCIQRPVVKLRKLPASDPRPLLICNLRED
jgi:hypothetical protein